MRSGEALKGERIQSQDYAHLMARTQSGDRSSYRLLLSEIESLLRKYIGSQTRRLGLLFDDEQDLVQEILLAIHQKRQTYDPAQPFLPWMYAIAHYKVIDHFRRCKNTKAIFADITLETQLEIGASPQNTGDELDWKTLVDRLPEKQRNILQLVKIEGLSVEEATQRTGYSASDIKISVHRALKVLKEWVK